jgi:hypothetical protein
MVKMHETTMERKHLTVQRKKVDPTIILAMYSYAISAWHFENKHLLAYLHATIAISAFLKHLDRVSRVAQNNIRLVPFT